MRKALVISGVASALALFVTAGALALPCTAPDNGAGTAYFPPPCPFVGSLTISAGLPAGTTIAIAGQLSGFAGIVRTGGNPGVEIQDYTGTLLMNMTGTGTLAGFTRSIALPVTLRTYTNPYVPYAPTQSYICDLNILQGQITGDPDFDLLRITAGNTFGLPSPGNTTLSANGGGAWDVYSYFDILSRIDFVGKAGGALGGLSGSTVGTDRFVAGDPSAVATAAQTWGALKSGYQSR